MKSETENNVSNALTSLEENSERLLDSVLQTEKELKALYKEITASAEPVGYCADVKTRLRSYKRASGNIMKAYRRTAGMRGELSARWNDLTKGRGRKLIPAAPSNAKIDLAESEARHFARGKNIYKLLLICYIGSFVGVVIETLWCFLTHGVISSRAGLVYGPFSLLYGFAAVLLTLCLYEFRNKGRWISFLGGAVICSVLEYVCSWWQEISFGTRSWDYSKMPFNINGRICLLYSVFWGLLGVFWIKTLYPWLSKLILKIPNKRGKTLTWLLTAFFVFNSLVTLIALARWSQRVELIEPANAFLEFIDLRFPNERMERIFSNMKHIKFRLPSHKMQG